MDQQSLSRINELAAIAKKRALTREEIEEREKLRRAYLAAFRSQFIQKMETTTVEYPDGTQVPLKDAARRGKEEKK